MNPFRFIYLSYAIYSMSYNILVIHAMMVAENSDNTTGVQNF